MKGFPQIGSIWRHYKGNIYKVEGYAKSTVDESYSVLYRQFLKGRKEKYLWSRPITEWFNVIESGWGPNCEKPRFTLIKPKLILQTIKQKSVIFQELNVLLVDEINSKITTM